MVPMLWVQIENQTTEPEVQNQIESSKEPEFPNRESNPYTTIVRYKSKVFNWILNKVQAYIFYIFVDFAFEAQMGS